MIIDIILGAIAGYSTLFFGNMFWSVHRRKHVIRSIFDDDAVLAKFVTYDLLRDPPPSIARYAPHGEVGWARMSAFVTADLRTQGSGQRLLGMITIEIILSSAFLGVGYFIINTILFFLLLLGRPGRVAIDQAIEWVQVMAVLLWRWRESSPDECAASVVQMGAPDMECLHAYLTRLAKCRDEETGEAPNA